MRNSSFYVTLRYKSRGVRPQFWYKECNVGLETQGISRPIFADNLLHYIILQMLKFLWQNYKFQFSYLALFWHFFFLYHNYRKSMYSIGKWMIPTKKGWSWGGVRTEWNGLSETPSNKMECFFSLSLNMNLNKMFKSTIHFSLPVGLLILWSIE